MNKNRFPNLLESPESFLNWKGIIMFIGVFKISLITDTKYLLVIIDMKTGEILTSHALDTRISPSIIVAFLAAYVDTKISGIDFATTLIHTQAGHPFTSKVFKAILKGYNFTGSTFLRTEHIPFSVKLFIILTSQKLAFYNVDELFLAYYKCVKKGGIAPNGENIKSLPLFPVEKPDE